MHFYWNADFPYVVATVAWVAALAVCEILTRKGKTTRLGSISRVLPVLPILYTLAYVTATWIPYGRKGEQSWLYTLGDTLVGYSGGWNVVVIVGAVLVLDFLGAWLYGRTIPASAARKVILVRRLYVYLSVLWLLPPLFWLCYVTTDWSYVRDYGWTWYETFWNDTVISCFGLMIPALLFSSVGLLLLGKKLKKRLQEMDFT